MRTQAAVHDLRLVNICADTHGVHDGLGLLVDLLCVEWTSLPFMISVMSIEGGRDVIVIVVVVVVVAGRRSHHHGGWKERGKGSVVQCFTIP